MNLKKCTIMYVEDESALVDLMEDMLKDMVLKFYKAENGKVGLEMYEKYQPDIVISDIMMPLVNGVDMSKSIKLRNPKQCILILSAFDNIETLKQIIEIGVNAFEAKPIKQLSKFLDKLENYATEIVREKEFITLQRKLFNRKKVIDKHLLVTTSDLHGNITSVSQALLDLTGYKKEELLGKNHSIFKHSQQQQTQISSLWDTLSKNNAWSGEIENKKKNGDTVWVDAIIEPLFDEVNEKYGYIAIKHNITDKKRIEFLSITDSLTNLFNRRQFNKTFEAELIRARRHKKSIGLILIDIDYFKQYNDFYGHPKGDKVLKDIGTTLNELLSDQTGFAFRIGGEEFALIICNLKYKEFYEYSKKVIQKIRDLQIEHKMSAISDKVTISMGCILSDAIADDEEIDSLYATADDLLYKAKRNGKDKFIAKRYLDDTEIKSTPLDSLTKLPVRSTLVNTLNTTDTKVMLMIINLENFNLINTHYGYEVAESVLLDRAKRYRRMMNKNAILFRLNLSEFAILVLDEKEFDKYFLMVQHYVLEDSNCNECDDLRSQIFVTQVVGIAIGNDNILNKADLALKKANELNRNFFTFDDDVACPIENDFKIMENMNRYRKALEDNRLVPYFQPIVDAKTGIVYKYEALARLIDEDGTVISPYEFLDSIQKDRTSEFFTRQLLQKIFKIYSLNKGMKVSINLTYENICTPRLIEYIKNRLDTFGGEGITFEIIESEEIDDYDNIAKFIKFIKEYGCTISIDDFGSGYSNIAYLMKLNPDYLKLDGSIVQNIDKDFKSEQIVKSLIEYTKRTGSKVIGEFVSNERIAKKSIEIGIDLLQGYYYGKPELAEFYDLKVPEN